MKLKEKFYQRVEDNIVKLIKKDHLKTKKEQYGDFEIILLLKALKGQVKECAGFDPEIEKAVKYLTKRGVENV